MSKSTRIVWLARRCGVLVLAVAMALSGCRSRARRVCDDSLDHFQQVATRVEYPDIQLEPRRDVLDALPPRTIRDGQPPQYWDLTLQDALRIALENSQTIRDIGGTVIRSPLATSTVYDPAIQESDPRTGTEAALSAFDADLATSLFVSRNQRAFNNFFVSGGAIGPLSANAGDFRTAITKRAATGTQFSLRHQTLYDRNNAPRIPDGAKLFWGAYDTVFEAEIRHPLLRGGGITFNRIAGPNATPGNYNGVLVARIRTDLALADFERAVRDLSYDVERTYWELLLAYRNLDATTEGRDAALQIWQAVRNQLEVGVADREQEALARERYYAAQAAAENALSGGGLSSGVTTLPSGGGVFAVERRLRFLIGLPTNDGLLIRPADDPLTVDVRFDWNDSVFQALTRRVELRKQQWTVKQRELELVAARNLVRVQFDLVSRYRRRGFGDKLFGNDKTEFNSAFESLATDSLDDWELGFELSSPIGNRIGHVGVRNAELRLARDRAIYRNQELEVSHELSAAITELDRAYIVTRTSYNRAIAARQQTEAIREKYEGGVAPLEFLLDAIRRAVESDIAYYRSLVDYSLAIADVHLARGTLLPSHNIYMEEGPWPDVARLAAERQSHHIQRCGRLHNYTVPWPVTGSGGARHPVPESKVSLAKRLVPGLGDSGQACGCGPSLQRLPEP